MTLKNDIHWHDTVILSVRIIPERAVVEMRVLYPKNWETASYEEGTLVFEDAYGYKEFESPFEGNPTILSANVTGTSGRWSQLRLETNAGYREVFCRDARLELG